MNKEQLSALVDDEVAIEDCQSLIAQLSNDEDARRRWSRYHLIGAVLNEAPAAHQQAPADVVALQPRRTKTPSPLAGLAIAASVAIVAVMLVLRGEPQSPDPAFKVAETLQSAAVQEPVVAAAISNETPRAVNSLSSEPAAAMVPVGAYDQRLNGYLVNFNEQRSRRGVSGVHPYVHIVGFEAE